MRLMAEQSGWLARQPTDFRREVLNECLLQTFERGSSIYHLGDPPGGIYGVAAGDVAVSIAPGEGGPYLTHIGTAGAWRGKENYILGFNEYEDGSTVQHALEARGITIHRISYGNHTENGGSIRCSTRPLVRRLGKGNSA